jgi:alginate O-acetyltransferase complex protein AlgI
MSFLSLNFFLFMGAVFFLNRIFLKRLVLRKTMLLAASYYFYMVWDWRFASLVLIITLVNYLAGARIAAGRSLAQKRAWLGFAIVVCLGVLAYFKYVNFLLSGFLSILESFGLHPDIATLQVILPIGISFFTFQALSYSIDIYRGKEVPCRSVLDFSLFVAFFPTILSGPITRSRDLLPQFREPFPDSGERLESGLILVVKGFVKKVALADVLAVQIVNPAFQSPELLSPAFLLLAVYAYSFQIYMDLSGYTDIARGSAKMLGFELPENFNRPYLAESVSNFWQRWHISMSSFFRDYLYFGVGGSNKGNVYINLMITFVAIGIWHGAGMKFVIYGFLHGGMVGIERWGRGRIVVPEFMGVSAANLARAIGVIFTFNFISFSRILFRAPDISGAFEYLISMSKFGSEHLPFTAMGLVALSAAAILHWCPRRWVDGGVESLRMAPAVVQGAMIVAVGCALLAIAGDFVPFIYFQF